jgi:general stress protein YciG
LNTKNKPIFSIFFQIKPDDRERMKDLLPLLDKLASKHPHEEVQDMANDIRIAIATYGAVWTDALSSAAKKYSKTADSEPANEKVKATKLTEKKSADKITMDIGDSGAKRQSKSLIEEVKPNESSVFNSQTSELDYSRTDLQSGVMKETGAENFDKDKESGPDVGDEGGESEGTLLGQCLNELCDPLIPVRGHALITLTRLTNEKDGATLDKKDLLLEIFKENIAHDDSYIYLAAINGLAGLSELCPLQILPVLAEEFIGVVDSTRRPRTVELRTKLAEVLMKVSRSLGK